MVEEEQSLLGRQPLSKMEKLSCVGRDFSLEISLKRNRNINISIQPND